jgi:glycosyltransferase involved in cell wall biosynthesis
MPRVSVIIPAFNVAGYVARAVESALDQTYRDLEVIVVNDGSSDTTDAALQPFADRIRYVEQSHKGIGAARNAGLQLATGSIIALLDADDWWMPARLARMVEYLADTGSVGFATSDAFLVRNGRTLESTFYGTAPRLGRFAVRNQRARIMQGSFVFVMALIRRELFERHGFFREDLPACADWDLWLRFILRGERAGLVNEPLAFYRLRADSASTNEVAMLQGSVMVLESAIETFGSTPELRARLTFQRARHLAVCRDSSRAKVEFRRAALTRGLRVEARAASIVGAMIPRLIPSLSSRYRRRRRTR